MRKCPACGRFVMEFSHEPAKELWPEDLWPAELKKTFIVCKNPNCMLGRQGLWYLKLREELMR